MMVTATEKTDVVLAAPSPLDDRIATARSIYASREYLEHFDRILIEHVVASHKHLRKCKSVKD
jgi:hypothetical protein